ncbi:MAG: PstS family phosphate ABC transporter substrate-binding protein [Pseudodesulfovibrio sp.]
MKAGGFSSRIRDGAFALAAFLLLVFAGPPCSAAGKAIRVVGSTTMGPMVREMVVAYQAAHPDLHFSLTGSGSASGAAALASGAADVALLSRGMSRQETVSCVRNGIAPQRFVLALDGLAPIVHPDNPVADLSLRQLRAIYSGGLVNWRGLGGPDLAVEPLARSADSGTRDIWLDVVMARTPEMGAVERVDSNAAMVRAVRARPGAIGYVGMGFVDETVRAVRLEGAEATPASVLEDSYPAARTLNVYIGKESAPEVRAFAEFVLGNACRPIIERAGFIPAPHP